MINLEFLKHKLSVIRSISLNDMDNVKLMNRLDTKYIFNAEKLNIVLENLKKNYRVLEVDGRKISKYKTVYFDTSDFMFYIQHHNKKLNRNKVRFRKYVDTELSFLEIKKKNNKGRTIKNRINLMENEFSNKVSKEFIYSLIGKDLILEKKHVNTFNRITLVNNLNNERVTIDTSLQFMSENQKVRLENLVIAEIKQNKKNRKSVFVNIMKDSRIRPYRISKYCLGSTFLFPELKKNRFKKKIKYIKKLLKYD